MDILIAAVFFVLGAIVTFVISRHFYSKTKMDIAGAVVALVRTTKSEDAAHGDGSANLGEASKLPRKIALDLIAAYERNAIYRPGLEVAAFTLGKAGQVLDEPFLAAHRAASQYQVGQRQWSVTYDKVFEEELARAKRQLLEAEGIA